MITTEPKHPHICRLQSHLTHELNFSACSTVENTHLKGVTIGIHHLDSEGKPVPYRADSKCITRDFWQAGTQRICSRECCRITTIKQAHIQALVEPGIIT